MKTLIRTSILVLGASALIQPVLAQDADNYPERSVTYIVPFDAGGASDISARLQQKYYTEENGQQAIIQYMAGAGGAQAWSRLNDMEGDGYTMMGTNLPHIILQPMGGNVGYQTSDIVNVNFFQYTPSVIVVAEDSDFQTLDDLIAYAEENPGQLTFSGSSSRSGDEVAKERFDELAGVVTTYIPFSGTGPATAALLGGQVMASVTYTTEAVNQGDQLRVLAVAADERLPSLPDAPTFQEQGYDFVGGAYRGVGVPGSTPEDMRHAVSESISRITANAEFAAEMEAGGFVPVDITYAEMDDFVDEQTAIYVSVAESIGLVPAQ